MINFKKCTFSVWFYLSLAAWSCSAETTRVTLKHVQAVPSNMQNNENHAREFFFFFFWKM